MVPLDRRRFFNHYICRELLLFLCYQLAWAELIAQLFSTSFTTATMHSYFENSSLTLIFSLLSLPLNTCPYFASAIT